MTKHIGMPTRKIVQIYFYVLVCRAKKCHWNLPKGSKSNSIHQAQSSLTIFLIWEKTVPIERFKKAKALPTEAMED